MSASKESSAATYYEVITVATGNTLAVFDTREEAESAASEYDHEVTVVGFDKDGLAQESPAAWIPDVTTGQCHQKQDDGSWIPCACKPGEPCASYTGGGSPLAANGPHFVTVVLQVEKSWADHGLLAEAVADDLRDAGWTPLGISVYDVPRTGRIIHGDAE